VPSASANGRSNGIVWALDRESKNLFAYDATDLTKVQYESGTAAGGRDSFASVGGHFITPMVAKGRVYYERRSEKEEAGATWFDLPESGLPLPAG
jgi:hypothetical protein